MHHQVRLQHGRAALTCYCVRFLRPQFEKADNKAAIIGWSAAGLGAFFFTEWLIHLPGLNLVRLPRKHTAEL